jgi:hypothetical protein
MTGNSGKYDQYEIPLAALIPDLGPQTQIDSFFFVSPGTNNNSVQVLLNNIELVQMPTNNNA